jgi:hypothetical protein
MSRLWYGVFALALAALAFLLFAPLASSRTTYPSLNAVASTFAMRPVSVLCYGADEPGSPYDLGAWGYVRKPLRKAHRAHLDADLCDGALDINGADTEVWQRALGVLVLVHESYHLRRWGAAGDEAKVECKAIRHVKVGARMLGASESTVEELWPFALASHYRLAEFRVWLTDERPYYDPDCDVPPLFDPP